MTGETLSFSVTASHGEYCEALQVYIEAPVVLQARPGRWTCVYGWLGSDQISGEAYGATSLGALANAITLLEVRLRNAFPGIELMEDGLPFLFRDPG